MPADIRRPRKITIRPNKFGRYETVGVQQASKAIQNRLPAAARLAQRPANHRFGPPAPN
jgi:hypothetical protein